MTCYYNENDPYAADWLRRLIAAGELPAGEVDERSIEDVDAGDLRGYEQAHFFAGIGGWPLALEWADWEGPVWTGSCPCQPLSGAGLRGGHRDKRHLWPAFHGLIAECRPAIVFGEEVGGPLGRAWMSAVRLDMEAMGYACGCADLPASSIGAPHIRQRLYWMAYADGVGSARHCRQADIASGRGGAGGGLADSSERGREQGIHGGGREEVGRGGEPNGLAVRGADDGLANANGERGRTLGGGLSGDEEDNRRQSDNEPKRDGAGAWEGVEWLPCGSEIRPTEPGLLPLAHGISGRMGRIRAYGNAVVPQLAEAFIRAARDAAGEEGR